MGLNEVYQCDKCNAVLSIKAAVQFQVQIKDELNLKAPYRTSFKKEKLVLPED